uniref:Uncharacterized protein n=1 Tax=Aegilops tauschii subsp. strangulata TaxID=200361 RepID=A0A452XDA2_AEGTS
MQIGKSTFVYFRAIFLLHLICSLFQIHIPLQCIDEFILFTLDQDTRTVYILDPTPINPMYRYNPLAKYVKKIIWISEHLPKAMSEACPGSRWNEDILLWHHRILDDIPVYNRYFSEDEY